ncbi:MAG TPA: hypothetical protein VFG99_11105, partial [Chloroflexia bacterium]|nr:hypothetical protein [Chloroflexia bacterium]
LFSYVNCNPFGIKIRYNISGDRTNGVSKWSLKTHHTLPDLPYNLLKRGPTSSLQKTKRKPDG